jgi:hypothetical protein
MASKLFFSIYILYCFEVGLFLIVFPWMDFWADNALLYSYPFLKPIFLNSFFRGAVAGLGLANIVLGVWEIAHFRYYFGGKRA